MDVKGDRMPGPQKEHGYTPIANEIMEQVAKLSINATQFRILIVVWRYTYGFNRKEHTLSRNFIAEATGIHKIRVGQELEDLFKRNILIEIEPPSFSAGRVISFNKYYDEWDKARGSGTKTLPGNENVTWEQKGEVAETLPGSGNVTRPGSENATWRGSGNVTQDKQNIKTNIKTYTAGEKKQTNGKKISPVKSVIDYYHKSFVERFQEKPVITNKKDGDLIKKLVNAYGSEKVEELLDKFFAADDEFIKQSGYTIGVFYSQVNKLLTARDPPQRGRL